MVGMTEPETARTRRPRVRDERLVCITMTRDAAVRFSQALGYADTILASHAGTKGAPETRGEDVKHGEWLRWGMGRIARSAPLPCPKSPAGDFCDLRVGHEGPHVHDRGPLGPQTRLNAESRHKIVSWP